MRIAISATGPTLDAEVDPRFGRCQYFIIVDPETMEFEALENSNAMASGGAGISTAQMIAGKGVEVVLTGNCGPNAYQVLSAAGLQVITGVSGKIRDAIEEYKLGTFSAAQQPNVTDHFGVSYGGGMGAGVMPPVSPAPQSSAPREELETLRGQSQSLAQQLAEMQRHIEELDKLDKEEEVTVMPISEYQCTQCGEWFAVHQSVGEDSSKLSCPKCKAQNPKRVPSSFFNPDSSTSEPSEISPINPRRSRCGPQYRIAQFKKKK